MNSGVEIDTNGSMDLFINMMKNNTVLDCKILQLQSFVKSIKNQSKELDQQIESENQTNKRLRSEIEEQDARELQMRTTLRNTNLSKELIKKLINDLREKLNIENTSYLEKKAEQEKSVKEQLMRWEEYKKLYMSLPLAKEVENESIALKKLEVEKKIKQQELKEMKKKIEENKAIHEKLYAVHKKKLEDLLTHKEELKKRSNDLAEEKVKLLKKINNLKEEKNQLKEQIKKEAGLGFAGIKRPAQPYLSPVKVSSYNTLDLNSSPTNLPQLPTLKLPQLTLSGRKIRRIEMLDTTLHRPSDMNLIQQRPSLQSSLTQRQLSQSSLTSPPNARINHASRNVTSNQRSPRKICSSSSLSSSFSTVRNESEFNSPQNSQIEVNVNTTNMNLRNYNNQRSNIPTANNYPQSIVKPIINDVKNKTNLVVHFENGNESNNNTSVKDNASKLSQETFEEKMQVGGDENVNVGKEIIDAEKENIEVQDMVNNQSCDKFSNDDKMDDGYGSQMSSQMSDQSSQVSQSYSLLMQHHSQPWQQTTGRTISNVQGNIGNVQKQCTGTMSLESIPSSNSSFKLPLARMGLTSSCTSMQESEETQSKYFIAQRRNETMNSDSDRNKFKSPLPPRQMSSSSNLNYQEITPVKSITSNKETEQSKSFSQNNQNQISNDDDDDGMAETSFYTSGNSGQWSPPQINTNNMSSPPRMPMQYSNDSYLNLLSPPGPEGLEMNGENSRIQQTDGPSSSSMNMFGGLSKTKDETGSGFSFAPKLPAASSFFSMFK